MVAPRECFSILKSPSVLSKPINLKHQVFHACSLQIVPLHPQHTHLQLLLHLLMPNACLSSSFIEIKEFLPQAGTLVPQIYRGAN